MTARGGVRWGTPGQPGPVALVGSGEYLPAMDEVDRTLLAGRPPVCVQIPTAAAPDGPERVKYWVGLGAAHAWRLGVLARAVAVADAADAERDEFAAAIPGAGLVYLSGGHPTHLARALRGTNLWRAVDKEWRSGAALAGCSAGAMALTSWVPSVRDPDRPPVAGLDVVPHLRVIPHFDRFSQWYPDLVSRYRHRLPAGVSVVGIDEETALVGGPHRWQVMGRRSCWTLTENGPVEHRAGSTVEV